MEYQSFHIDIAVASTAAWLEGTVVLVEGLIAGLGDFGNIKHRVLLCCLLLFFVQKWRGGGSKDISTLVNGWLPKFI